MVGCVLGQLKPSELYIFKCGKGLGLLPGPFPTAKNVELLGLYPIQNARTHLHTRECPPSTRTL